MPGFYKNNETSSGGFEADGDLPHSIPGQYPNTTSRERKNVSPYLFGMSDVQSPGAGDQQSVNHK